MKKIFLSEAQFDRSTPGTMRYRKVAPTKVSVAVLTIGRFSKADSYVQI